MIIGFAGKAQSGKTTAAKSLKPFGFRVVSFGSGVKEECVAFLEKHDVDFIPENFYGSIEQKEETLVMESAANAVRENFRFLDFVYRCNPTRLSSMRIEFTPRMLMQWWGTNYRRCQDPFYWQKRCYQRAKALLDEGHKVAIDDVRFPDEGDMVTKNLNGLLFYVIRDPQPFTKHSDHISESAMTDYDGDMGTLFNVGTIEEFEQAVQHGIRLHTDLEDWREIFPECHSDAERLI